MVTQIEIDLKQSEITQAETLRTQVSRNLIRGRPNFEREQNRFDGLTDLIIQLRNQLAELKQEFVNQKIEEVLDQDDDLIINILPGEIPIIEELPILQVTPEETNNTLRNVLLVGGALLLIL